MGNHVNRGMNVYKPEITMCSNKIRFKHQNKFGLKSYRHLELKTVEK